MGTKELTCVSVSGKAHEAVDLGGLVQIQDAGPVEEVNESLCSCGIYNGFDRIIDDAGGHQD